jgi:hypothetical protein
MPVPSRFYASPTAVVESSDSERFLRPGRSNSEVATQEESATTMRLPRVATPYHACEGKWVLQH